MFKKLNELCLMKKQKYAVLPAKTINCNGKRLKQVVFYQLNRLILLKQQKKRLNQLN